VTHPDGRTAPDLPTEAVTAAERVARAYYTDNITMMPTGRELEHLAAIVRRALEAAAPALRAQAAVAEREQCMPLTAERVNELEAALREVLAPWAAVRDKPWLQAPRISPEQYVRWQALLDGPAVQSATKPALCTLGNGDLITIEWSGELRTVVVVVDGRRVSLRDLNADELRQMDDMIAGRAEDRG